MTNLLSWDLLEIKQGLTAAQSNRKILAAQKVDDFIVKAQIKRFKDELTQKIHKTREKHLLLTSEQMYSLNQLNKQINQL
jgi:tmRNA-binding protein